MGLAIQNAKHPVTGQCCTLHLDKETGLWMTEDGVAVEEKDIRSVDSGSAVEGLVLVAAILIAGLAVARTAVAVVFGF